jgi:hypothetical protein
MLKVPSGEELIPKEVFSKYTNTAPRGFCDCESITFPENFTVPACAQDVRHMNNPKRVRRFCLRFI